MSAHRQHTRRQHARGFRSCGQMGAEAAVMVPLLRGLRLALAEEAAAEAALEPLDRLLRDRRERIACDWAHPD